MSHYGFRQLWDNVQLIYGRLRYDKIPNHKHNDIELPTAHWPQSAHSHPTRRDSTQDPSRKENKPHENITLLGSTAKGKPASEGTKVDGSAKLTRPGWVAGVYLCANASVVVLLINLVLIGVLRA